MKIDVSRCYAGRPLRGDRKKGFHMGSLLRYAYWYINSEYFTESLMQQTDADKKSGQVENNRTVREYVSHGINPARALIPHQAGMELCSIPIARYRKSRG